MSEAQSPADVPQAAEPPRQRHRAPIAAPELNRGRTLSAAAENIGALFAAEDAADDGVTSAPNDTTPRTADGKFLKREAPPDDGDDDGAIEAAAEPDALAPDAAETAPDVGAFGVSANEEKAVETIAELAELLDVDPSVIYALDAGLGTGPDGETERLSIGALKDRSTEARATLAQRAKLTEAQEALSRERAELHEATRARIGEADGAINLAQQRLLAKYQGEEMAALRVADPAEWTAKQAEMHQEAAALQEAKQSVQAQRQAAEQEQEARQAQELQALIAKESAALVEAVPEWRDPQTASAEKTAIAEYLRESGFPDQEVGNIAYARHIVLARKAMAYDRLQKEGKEAVTRVLKLSKVQRPGKRQGSAQVADAGYTRAKQALKKSGSMADAAKAISLMR